MLRNLTRLFADTGHHGIGIDIDASVVEAANELLRDNGCDDRFAVRRADMREASAFAEGPFDVITAYQNVYYFDSGERTTIWRRCREALTPNGRLLRVAERGARAAGTNS